MEKTITLMGKAATYYFNARCAFKIDLAEQGMAARDNSVWQKSLKDASPYRKRLFSHELYPVLITEYRPDGNRPNYEGETEMIMVNVTGDLM